MLLKTTAEVIKQLGGNQAVAKLCGATNFATSNWKRGNWFPARSYLIITRALAEKGHRAPVSLWGMW